MSSITPYITDLNTTLIGYIILFPIFFLWIYWIIFTTVDIVRKTDNIIIEFFCIILVAFLWPLWWLIYLAIRPKLTLEEKAIQEALLANFQECLNCWQQNPLNYRYCINCWSELKTVCKECKKEYYKGYSYCPYCSAPNIDIH